MCPKSGTESIISVQGKSSEVSYLSSNMGVFSSSELPLDTRVVTELHMPDAAV